MTEKDLVQLGFKRGSHNLMQYELSKNLLLRIQHIDTMSEYISVEQTGGNAVYLYDRVNNGPLHIEKVQDIINVLGEVKEHAETTFIERIKQRVASRNGLSVSDLYEYNTLRSISEPRQIAIFLVYKFFYTELSLSDIAREFHRNNHVTVSYAINRVRDRMLKSPSFKREIEYLINEFKMKTDKVFWTNTLGEQVDIDEMSEEYLRNVLKMLCEKKNNDVINDLKSEG